jgi:carboxyl-terminal processing protease
MIQAVPLRRSSPEDRSAAPKSRSGRSGPRLAVLFCFFAVFVAVPAAALALTKDQSPYAAIAQLARVLVLVENNFVEPVDRGKILQGAIKGMVAELDPHSSYLPAEDFKLFQSETEGTFGGVGIEVDARTDTITVIAPIDGSPAARAGIRSGDKVVGIDGKPTRGLPLERVVRSMRGNPGTRVKLTVQRPGVDSPIDFELVREQIRVTSVVGKRLEGDVAYLRVKQFQQSTHEEFLRAIGRIRDASPAPIAGLVLDLRSNPGGLVDQAALVADDILDGGVIYTTRHRGSVVEEAKAHAGGPFAKTPVAVLVNEYSASAAELVAGAIQDQRRGVVVGATTFGKGSVQSILDLPDGAGLKLTTMLYFTPSGRSIQAEGVHPDVAVAPGVERGAGIPVTRERDIEGHLTPEALGIGDAGGAPDARAEAGTGRETAPAGPFEIAREVSSNPAQGKDLALSIAYQIVRSVIGGSGPKAPR